MAGPLPLPVPESSGFARTSSHAEVMAFLEALSALGNPRIHVTGFGTSAEGRALPLVVVADPPVRSAEEARRDGRPRVLVMANIHAGEVEGKEACLRLLGRLAAGDPPYPVRDAVFLCAPIYNADGNERLGPANRPGQQGPSLVGQRPNAQGLDLNRDYLKGEAPETRALLRLLADWDPHVVVDLHTTNGSPHGYELTYAPPLSPSAHPDLLAVLEEDWLPGLRRRMRDRGYETFDYGNFLTEKEEFKDAPDRTTGWRTFDHRPRFGTNYVGLRNRLAILSEAYSYADFRTRIDVTEAFVAEILSLAAARGKELPGFCARLDRQTAAAGEAGGLLQATGARLVSRGVEPILLRAVEDRVDPATGTRIRIASGPKRPMKLPCFTRFAASAERTAPRVYYVLPEAAPDVAEILTLHGIVHERLARPEAARVEVHAAKEALRATQPFQGHRLREFSWAASEEERLLPAGALKVPTAQPLARLVFHLLDPRADDGLFVWNFFDAALAGGPGAEAPVYGVR